MFDGISIPGYVVFAAVGYFCGWCFRDIGLLKILLMLLIVPTLLQWVIQIDEILWVTLPFLLGAVIGYWGFAKTQYKLLNLKDELLDLRDRFR